MIRSEYLDLLAEKGALEGMIAETPPQNVLDRASLVSRLGAIDEAIASAGSPERDPARARLTFSGRPVIGTHGIFAEFGMKATNGFAESVTAMAASLAGPLAPMGPIRNRDQHQLLITSTALGSFGFELEEYRSGQFELAETSPVAQALERTQEVLRGSMGTDDELADSAVDADRRALDKIRAFLKTLADNDAVCALQVGESRVAFSDVGQVRTSLERLSPENLREETTTLTGEVLGVLPISRVFEFKLADSGQTVRVKIGPGIAHPHALNAAVGRLMRVHVTMTRIGSGRPRYVLTASPEAATLP